MKASIAVLGAFLATTLATPLLQSISERKPYTCNTFTIPISVENVPSIKLPIPPITSQYEATSIANAATSRAQPMPELEFIYLNRTYSILAQYCIPRQGAISSTLQILTHGIGFNSSYWDFYASFNTSDSQYSYIAAATAAGYATLSYNRLGISGSTLPDPYSEVQTPAELAVLAQLTILARAGKIQGQITAPAKVVHVAHSMGSILTNALAATYPELSDGVVLTGYLQNFQYQGLFIANTGFTIASQNEPDLFPASRYGTGYITWPSKWSNQFSFFAYPKFDNAVLDDAEATKQPFPIGELLTFALLGDLQAPRFTNPVLYVNGEKDSIFCSSNCTGLVGPDSEAYKAFNGTSDIESIIVQGFGHGLNLHLGAREHVYGPIQNWLSTRGF